MPAEIVTLLDCASNYGVFLVESSEPGAFYTVHFNGSEGGASCTCKAFQFSRERHCKHIQVVWDGACMYNPQWNTEGHSPVVYVPTAYTYDRIIPDEVCPACGGPVVAVRRAV